MMIQGNLVRIVNKILKWRVDLDKNHHESSKFLTDDQEFLDKVRITRSIMSGAYNSYQSIEKHFGKRKNLSNHEIMMIKHMSLTLLNSLLEMQRNLNLIKKLKKDIEIEVLKKVMCEVYSKFSISYKKKYSPHCLKHVSYLKISH